MRETNDPRPIDIMKQPKRSKYDEPIKIDASPKDVAIAIMRKPPKRQSEWRFLKKPR